MVVLMVDDQEIVGVAVRRMLADQPDIEFHHITDPLKALQTATELRPTVILQDLVMPEIDGLKLVRYYRAHGPTKETPLIVLSAKMEPAVKAESFALGANDYLVKLPDKLELVARIRYHSQAYINLIERNEAYSALGASQQQLSNEMEAGARYVASLLPDPIHKEGPPPLIVDWRFIPSAQLGGDSLDYFTIDDDHFAIYVLDVAGHGLASALLGVTVTNLLRARGLSGVDFRQPNQVLASLNRSFQMDQHAGRFFTMWYAVYEYSTRQLTWSGAGHPGSLYFPAAEPGEIENPPKSDAQRMQIMDSQNPGVGMFEWEEWEQAVTKIPQGSKMFIYSDGAFEIHMPDGRDWSFQEFQDFMCQPAPPGIAKPDDLVNHVRQLKAGPVLDDDFSIIEVLFSE